MAEDLFPPHLADITFEVGTGDQAQTFEAIRTTFRAHSFVFECMINGPWAEGTQGSPNNLVRLPDDDPTAFGLLPNILYHNMSIRGSAPAAEDVLSFAMLCDKYNFTRLARDLMQCRIDAENKYWIKDHKMTPEELCFKGWSFRLLPVFELGWLALVETEYYVRKSNSPTGEDEYNGRVHGSLSMSGSSLELELGLLHDGACGMSSPDV